MKLATASFLLLSNSGVSANRCTEFCEQYVRAEYAQKDVSESIINSSIQQCQAIYCQLQRIEKKANLRAGAKSPADADTGILYSQDVSFVKDSAAAKDPYLDDIFYQGFPCFNQCSHVPISEEYFDCLDRCYDGIGSPNELSLVPNKVDVKEVVKDSVARKDAPVEIPCFNECNSIPVSEEYFYCLDRCFDATGGPPNELSLFSNKVDVKEESQLDPQCVRDCPRGSQYLECLAACYGFPSYCHYVCFYATNNNASYRRCVASCSGSSGNLGLFAKKMPMHVMK